MRKHNLMLMTNPWIAGIISISFGPKCSNNLVEGEARQYTKQHLSITICTMLQRDESTTKHHQNLKFKYRSPAGWLGSKYIEAEIIISDHSSINS